MTNTAATQTNTDNEFPTEPSGHSVIDGPAASSTTRSTPKGRRLAAQAYRSDERADAYRYLANLLATDPKLASIVEYERERLVRNSYEFEADAEDLREQALAAGINPMDEEL